MSQVDKNNSPIDGFILIKLDLSFDPSCGLGQYKLFKLIHSIEGIDMILHLDCREFRGDRPCRHRRPCDDCPHYKPMGPRLLLIKLGALGDVLRTGSLLPGWAAQTEPPHVTWLTSASARPLVERMEGVGRVLTFEPATLTQLHAEHFNTVVCLEKEAAPCGLAMTVPADLRQGIGLSRYGTVFPLGEECEYYFSLGLDDDEKFYRNRATYPKLIYEALGMTYRGECYRITPTAQDREGAQRILTELDPPGGATWIGLNPGAGNVFANKSWREEGYVELIHALAKQRPKVRILILGGPAEADLMERIVGASGEAPVHLPHDDYSLGVFAALVERCEVIVSGDTLAMHLAVALGRRSVALFGPTCPQEIDLFGRGEKIVSPIGCAPCYLRHCDKSPTCQDLIDVDKVLAAVLAQLEAAANSAEERHAQP